MSRQAREYIHMAPRPDDTVCDVHAWTADDFRKRLLAEMRARHGKGGLNVCVQCLGRAKTAVMPPLPPTGDDAGGG